MDKKTKFPEEEGSVPEGGPSLRPTLFTEHRALRPRDSVSACESRPRGSSPNPMQRGRPVFRPLVCALNPPVPSHILCFAGPERGLYQ